MSTKDSRGRNKLWPWRSIWKMRTTECNSNRRWNSLCNMASAWRSLDGSQQHSRKERLPWKLDFHAPTTDNGTSTRLPSVPGPLQCLQKGTGGSEQQWVKPGAYACGRRAYLQNSQSLLIYKTAVTAVQKQLEKVSQWRQESPKSPQARLNPCGAPSTTKQ